MSGQPYEHDGWQCTGLNHRGFIHRIEAQGVDLLPTLTETLATRGDLAMSEDVAELGAVPTNILAWYAGVG